MPRAKKISDSGQDYFWTGEWQKEEAEADEDIKAGRLSKTKNVKELIEKLKGGDRKKGREEVTGKLMI